MKIGDVWKVKECSKLVTITDVCGVNVCYRWEDGLLGRRTIPDFLEYWEPVQPEPAQQNDWSYAKADALLEAAKKAIAEYNEYIQRKPSTYYGSISTVGTRIEPQVQHTGDE